MKLSAVLLASATAYNNGACDRSPLWPGITEMVCKSKCEDVNLAGRAKKIKFKWKGKSEYQLQAEATVINQNKDKEYIGFLRFDKKFCSQKILRAIGYQIINVDVYDKESDNYFLEAAHFVEGRDGEDGESAIVQFRRGAYVNGELIWPAKKKDKILLSASGFYHWHSVDEMAKCFEKVAVLSLADDGMGMGSAGYGDYTKCILYGKNGFDVDWDEDDEQTTTEPDTGTTTMPPNTMSTNQYGWGKCHGNSVSNGVFGGERIVGGEEPERNAWPWIVALMISADDAVELGKDPTVPSCHGSIINDNHVLTAAQCCANLVDLAVKFTVRVGEHSLENDFDGQYEVDVKEMFIHPEFGKHPHSPVANDFCILRTDDLKLDGKTADIACLPEKGDTVEGGTNCWIAGWGTTQQGGLHPDNLQHASIPIIDDDTCFERMFAQGLGIIKELEMCAGKDGVGGVDTCAGDGGGPLMCVIQGEPVIYGLSSWGLACGHPALPGIYSEVQSAIDWINVVANELETTTSTEKPTTKPPGTGQTNQYGWRSCKGNVIHGDNKIVGGEEADPNSWPWIVGIVSSGGTRPWCGGSIISDKSVLTAAHCCDGIGSPDDVEIRVGMHNWSDGKNIRVKKVTKHHKYGANANSEIANDFCLLETDDIPLDGDKVDIVCLPKGGVTVKPNTMCFTAGWGTTSSGGQQSENLMMAKGPIVSDKKCADKYKVAGLSVIKGVEICFGYDEGGVDACQGDSGGPLICIDEDTQEPVLQGVVSWGIGCADKDFPGVNAEVQSAMAWIKQNAD